MTIKFHKKSSTKEAASLEDAHELGYFHGSISRDELMTRITKYNPQLRWIASEHNMGLFDTEKGFICAITRSRTIPMFSIFKNNKKLARNVKFSNEFGEHTDTQEINNDPDHGKMLARGWPVTLNIIEKKGYKVDRVGLPDSYFWDYKWKD